MKQIMMMKMRMLGFFWLLFSLLPQLGLTVAGQERVFEVIYLHEQNPPSSVSTAVSVRKEELALVSSSILAAESWLRSHVLTRYPSTNITTIVVGNDILCKQNFEHQCILVLPTVKNLYFSLIRWGLSKEIKVSASFSSACFESSSAQERLKPLLSFLQDSSLPYTISYESLGNLELSMKEAKPIKSHREFLQRLGFSRLRDIRVIGGAKPMKRKLSSLNPPSFAMVPGSSLSFAPFSSPAEAPANSPDVPAESPLTFCIPPVAGPAPDSDDGDKVGLWCVAKPTVPEEKLQEAMDFACGKGGADCDEIRPNGNCFNPDNLVAHASYAFNSYWQKTKQSGGSCNFDGTAILINSDPSFLHCRFKLL